MGILMNKEKDKIITCWASPVFYPSTFVYSHFPPKIQFLHCLLSSLFPWGIPIVDTKGKIFEIQVSWLLENAFPTIWLQKHSLYIVDKHDFFPWISLVNTFIQSCLFIFFVCSSSNFCWNFRVLWGVSKKSWQERYIQLSFKCVFVST